MRRILILTGAREAPHLGAFVQQRAAEVAAETVTDRAGLFAALAADSDTTRLISFCTGVLVPGTLLERLELTPYNIHPGPPEFPGLHPEAFALAAGARSFGATAHEMVEEIDAGAIVAVDRFDVEEGTRRLDLAAAAYERAVKLFARVVLHCFASDADLAPLDERWRGRAMRGADYRRLLAAHPELRLPDAAQEAEQSLHSGAVGI